MTEIPAVGFPFLEAFTSDRVPMESKDVYVCVCIYIYIYISLVTGKIPINYTSEFWELFEATTYIG